MKALIDGDLVAYRCAASAEKEEQWVSLHRADALMQEILGAVSADSYSCYLTGTGNFRKEIDPQYKANRKDKVLPVHLSATKEFLVMQWKAIFCEGYEADDALGIEATKDKSTIVCSLDKDLLQIPGQHYNWVKKEFKTVTPDNGLLAFYTQTLVGDTSDNITGVVGIGPVKAGKALNGLLPEEYYNVCREMYDDDERFHNNCRLLWVWREHGGTWNAELHSGSQEHQDRSLGEVSCG